MRKKIFEMVEPGEGINKVSSFYDYFMMMVIIVSLIPLAFKNENTAYFVLDKICVVIFIVDYILRWITSDYKYNKKSVSSFIRYPFSLMAIIDLVSILPSLTIINSGFKVFRVLRMIKAFRVFRVFKALRYSRSVEIIVNVLKRSKESLVAVGTLAVAYILIAALVIFNVEPDSFNSFFDAIYWATVSLTTVGYGDIYPITTIGRIVTMVSSIFGIAIVALPAGIITAGYMNEINSEKEEADK
ncbi:MAG: ion transporter [Acutalibacteraceae bacterium]|nr:ion transporter [Acutalibacteraceae bacterium]